MVVPVSRAAATSGDGAAWANRADIIGPQGLDGGDAGGVQIDQGRARLLGHAPCRLGPRLKVVVQPTVNELTPGQGVSNTGMAPRARASST